MFRISRFRRFSLRIFGRFITHAFKPGLVDLNLRRAKMGIGRVEFYSQVALYLLLFITGTGVVDTVFLSFSPKLAFFVFSLSFLAVVSFLAIILETPSVRIRTRRRKIDSVLTIASGFFATLASADIPIDTIIRDLGESRQYGEISREARSIWLRTELFGMDIISSIRETIKSSPSQKLSEFLQGIVTSVNSGGDLKKYFISKTIQYQGELSAGIKHNSNSMGILAESFVTVGVAFPLIFLIIVGIIAYLSPASPGGLILILIMTVSFVIPGIFVVFAYFFNSTMGEIEL